MKLMHFVARYVQHVAGADNLLPFAQPHPRPPMQDVDAVIVRVLIQAGVAARCDRKIAQVEVLRSLFGADQDLSCRVERPAILRPVLAHRHIIPAQPRAALIPMQNRHLILSFDGSSPRSARRTILFLPRVSVVNSRLSLSYTLPGADYVGVQADGVKATEEA